jgi:hypothetical protein
MPFSAELIYEIPVDGLLVKLRDAVLKEPAVLPAHLAIVAA